MQSHDYEKFDILNGSLKVWEPTDESMRERKSDFDNVDDLLNSLCQSSDVPSSGSHNKSTKQKKDVNPIPSPKNTPLLNAFAKGLTFADILAIQRMNDGVLSVADPSYLNWLECMNSFAKYIDQNCFLFHLEDEKETTSLSIEAIGLALLPKTFNISYGMAKNDYSNVHNSDNDNNNNNNNNQWRGPIIPIRYSYAKKGIPSYIKHMDFINNVRRLNRSGISPRSIICTYIRDGTFAIALNAFQQATNKLTTQCIDTFHQKKGWSLNHMFEISFLSVKNGQAVMATKESVHCSNVQYCNVVDTTMNKCAKCFTPYCSRECQLAHWPGHKRVCKLLQQGLDANKNNNTNTNANISNHANTNKLNEENKLALSSSSCSSAQKDNDDYIIGDGDDDNSHDEEEEEAGDDFTASIIPTSSSSISTPLVETRAYITINPKDPNLYKHVTKKYETLVSLTGAPSIPIHKTKKQHKLPFREGEFIVKLQRSYGGHRAIIYNETRDISIPSFSGKVAKHIGEFTELYPTPYPGLSEHPGKIKLYLYARVVQGDL